MIIDRRRRNIGMWFICRVVRIDWVRIEIRRMFCVLLDGMGGIVCRGHLLIEILHRGKLKMGMWPSPRDRC